MSGWIKRRPLTERSDRDVEAQLIAVRDGYVLYHARWPRRHTSNGSPVYETRIMRMPWKYWAERYAGRI